MFPCDVCYKVFCNERSLNGHRSNCRRAVSRLLPDRESRHSKEEKEKEYPDYHEVPNYPTDSTQSYIVQEEVEYPSREVSDCHTDADSTEALSEGSTEYLMYQKQIEKLYTYGEARMPKVKTTTGVYVDGSRDIFEEIVAYCSSRQHLSEDDKTELIQMIKKISKMNGREIPLPSRYSTLMAVIMEPLQSVRPKVMKTKLPYPVEIFGTNQDSLIPIETVVINLLETVASMLLETDVVGKNLENFTHKFTRQYNEDSERVYGDVTGAEWFKKTELSIQQKYGRDCYLLALNISSDKTQVDRKGDKSIWPCYVTIMNLTADIRRSKRGSEIVGYCPLIPYSTEKLVQLLTQDYGVIRKHIELVRLIRKQLEQTFLNEVLKQIRNCEITGPVSLLVGRGASQKRFKFMPVLMCYVSDNEGSHSCSCCKTGNTLMPCRMCEISRSNMMMSNISDQVLRESLDYNFYLKDAFSTFCQYCTKPLQSITALQKSIMAFCKQKSVQCLFPTLNSLAPSYPGHSSYERCPPDLLHTLIGLLESWISMVVTIVAKIASTSEAYSHAIAVLEDLLRTFPFKQAMPFRIKHFSKGLAVYCPGLNGSLDSKTTGYGNLGMIDNKDVPSLLFQILVCIGNQNQVIPANVVEPDLGVLNTVILSSGKLLLDTYFNFKQRLVRKMDLPTIQQYFEVAHFNLQKLFCWRQRLFNCNKPNTIAFKPHGCCHLLPLVPQYGAPENSDTSLYENMHIAYAKNAYKRTARVEGKLLVQMMNNVQVMRLARCLRSRSSTADDDVADSEVEPLKDSVIRYKTEANVIFECLPSTAFREEIVFKNNSLECKSGKPKFLSPNLTLTGLLKQLKLLGETSPSVEALLREMSRNSSAGTDVKMYLHKFFKFDASCYGFPLTYIYSVLNENETCRFDWVKVADNIPLQLCALVQIEEKCEGGTTKSYLCYVGTLCEYVDGCKHQVEPPFPVVRYKTTQNQLRVHSPDYQTGFVDDIYEPSCVIPVRGGSDDFILKDVQLMRKASFYVVPLQYLCRDSHNTMDLHLAPGNKSLSTVRTDRETRGYLRRNAAGRKQLYADLLESLRLNEDTDDAEDFHLLRQLQEERRRLRLFFKPSEYVLRSNRTTTIRVGDGLFTSCWIMKSEVVACFVGEFISHYEAIRRTKCGEGGYQVYVDRNVVLDCYKSCREGRCLASKANNSLHLSHESSGASVVANSKLLIWTPPRESSYDESSSSVPSAKVYIRALTDIPPLTEVCYAYGTRYTAYAS